MQLREAIHEFTSKLELTPQEQEEAGRQHVYLRTELQRRLNLDPEHQARLSGSYSRSTAIRPLHDVDVFCVLRPEGGQTPEALSPAAALGLVKRALEQAYPGKVTDRQNRSVNIAFTGTGVAFDVVPAFVVGGGFKIPDLGRRAWIRTDPRIHQERSVAANRAAGDDLKPLTKAVKHWNSRQPEGVQLRSFHMEVMAWELVLRKPPNRLAGLKELFDGLAWRVTRPVPDPAGLGPNLDEDLSQNKKQAAAQRLKGAAASIDRAMLWGERGDLDKAHLELYGLFGAPYPVRF